jgi:acetoin utilization protein AcuA
MDFRNGLPFEESGLLGSRPRVAEHVLVEGPVDPASLVRLSMNRFMSNFRPAERQKEALVDIARMNPGLVFVARWEQEIVAYVTFHRANPYTRWHRHTRILELGAVEVGREWRRRGLATTLLNAAFALPMLEDYIVITLEYYWHWDLRGTGLDPWGYRKMLNDLFGKAGMVEKNTDDSDIGEHPANILMARVGAHVSLVNEVAFKAMLFYQKSPSGEIRQP